MATKRELTGYQIAQIKKLLKEARNEPPGNPLAKGARISTLERVMYILELDPHEDER